MDESENKIISTWKSGVRNIEEWNQDILGAYNLIPVSKEVKVFNSTDHAADLFRTEYGEEFRDILLEFLDGLR